MNATLKRYGQLGVIILSAGVLYPLLYLRQNFEVTILETFEITLSQLSQGYVILGIMFTVSFVPSGWLADRVQPRALIVGSLLATGAIGAWFSTIPGASSIRIIFFFWGLTTGLAFWSAHIKAVSILAGPKEQGRFFGFLEGGRGLVEAVLATIAIAAFAYVVNALGRSNDLALQTVIYIYVAALWLVAPLAFFFLDDTKDDPAGDPTEAPQQTGGDLLDTLKIILKNEKVWLVGIIILTSYQFFWATYSFSSYLQKIYGLSAVAVGAITVAKLWTRPIGGIAAGLAGDFLNRSGVLGWLLMVATVSMVSLSFVPKTVGATLLIVIVLFIGVITYALRGLFWGTLDDAGVPNRIKGLAIGILSFVGYAPDIYLPLINAHLLETYPGHTGYILYFSGIGACGLIGAAAAWRLKYLTSDHAADPQFAE
ncbi:MAG: MFS transporter [Pseudomonadota bacterium]